MIEQRITELTNWYGGLGELDFMVLGAVAVWCGFLAVSWLIETMDEEMHEFNRKYKVNKD